MSSSKTARLVAVLILVESIKSKMSLSSVLERQLLRLAPAEHGFCKELCFGVMREFFVLEKELENFLEKKLKAKELKVKLLIFTGFYQLGWMRVPDYAAINETVALTSQFRKSWARSLVNAVLRKFQKSDRSEIRIENTHPEWLVARLKKSYSDEYLKILEFNQQRPPLILRVNKNRLTADEYVERLAKLKILAEPIAHLPDAIKLEVPVQVMKLPGFTQGWVSVQDASAQLAAMLLDVKNDHSILDACAAPGGKSLHILELAPDANLTALDNKGNRLKKISQNLKRSEKTAKLIKGDATAKDWWEGEPFDRILLDAPCSATGTIRRNPDVKVLLKEQDIGQLVATQQKILENCWQMLKTGGVLLYVTCSLLDEENHKQIEDFLARTKDARETKIKLRLAKEQKHGVQILGPDTGWDNFYYCKLVKF